MPNPQSAAIGKHQDTAAEILGQEGIDLVYVTSAGQAEEALNEILKADQPLGLDTETAKLPEFSEHPKSGLEPHLSRIRLIQIYGGNDKVYLFDMFKLPFEALSPIWRCRLVAHNAVFDMKHLFHAGAEPRRVGCTMLMANALTGKLPSLQALTRTHLGWDMSKEQRVSDWGAPELIQEQLYYAALDAVAVFRLYRVLKEQLRKANLTPVYTLMRDAQRAIARMELAGIYFDAAGLERLTDAWQCKKEAALRELRELLGLEVNPESSKQISQWLSAKLGPATVQNWPQTKTGQLKTDAATLARVTYYPLTKPLREFKEACKMLSTFANGYVEHINPVTGRIHASFRLGGTATGRLSCSAPNIQNPPRAKEFRALFSAQHSRRMVVADYSQIELRVAALVSGDKSMLTAYANGEDLHKLTASVIAQVPIDGVTPEQRQAAKAVNFGLLYGQGARGLARYARIKYGVTMSVKEADAARQAFFKAHIGLKRWQTDTGRKAEKTGKAVTPGGRIRDFNMEPKGYRYTETLNTPIQGGAAEVLLAALARLENHLRNLDAKLVNIVHDEIVLEVAEKDVQPAIEALKKAMTEGLLAIFPHATAVGLVEARAGINWAEAK